MDSYLIEQLNLLPSDNLSDKDKQVITEIFPVPKEQKILWAKVLSKGGNPSGYVITDKAFIYKAPKNDVKQINKEITENNKGKKRNEKENKIKYVYRVIPWDHYSPDLIKVNKAVHKNKEEYSFEIGGESYSSIDHDLYIFFNNLNEKLNTIQQLVIDSTFASMDSIALKNVVYNIDHGAAYNDAGHGFYAEDAGAMLDRLHGEKSVVVGGDNAKNGADKLVNGVNVQCKYYNSAHGSVDACFKKKADGNLSYRYIDLNDNPMQVEVPSDQYVDAVVRMKEHIKKGEVPGVTDPNQAEHLVRKGKITYAQARNLAKAGTIESISFDAANSAVVCLSALGVSAAVALAITYWKTHSMAEAAAAAFNTGISVYGLSFAANVLSSQVARTMVPKLLQPGLRLLSNIIGPQKTQSIINVIRSMAGKKAIYGAAAQNHFVKYLSTNFVSSAVMFVVFSIPDTIKIIEGKISKAQYVKNIITLAASMGGAAVGAAGGAYIGNRIGRFAGPLGFVGGTVGGAIVGGTTHQLLSLFREDDVIILGRMLNSYIAIEMIDNMLNEDEQNKLVDILNNNEKGIKRLIERLNQSKDQVRTIHDFMVPLIKQATSDREKIYIESEGIVRDGLSDFYGGNLGYEL